MVMEGIDNFRSTKSLSTATKILCHILNHEFQRRLDHAQKLTYTAWLSAIYKDHTKLIFEGAIQVFKQNREVGEKKKRTAKREVSAKVVNIALSIFHVYIALGTHNGNHLEEGNLSSISLCLDNLHEFDADLMSCDSFQLLCSSFHNLLAPAVYNKLRSSISQILNSLKEFRNGYVIRKKLIKGVRKKFNEAGSENSEAD
uniref:Uncharacterized protein n=1 Tax=Ditylenchus dipsaci TaxID=166011 RepID=A0A915DIG4_9BILA